MIESNENIAELISSLRIQGGKDKEEFVAHVLYCSGQTDTQYTRVGSKCIVDILLESGFICEENGVFKITQSNNIIDVEEDQAILESIDESGLSNNSTFKPVNDPTCYDNRPAIAINIQLQLPESDNPDVYENLFKSLRKNLIDD